MVRLGAELPDVAIPALFDYHCFLSMPSLFSDTHSPLFLYPSGKNSKNLMLISGELFH